MCFFSSSNVFEVKKVSRYRHFSVSVRHKRAVIFIALKSFLCLEGRRRHIRYLGKKQTQTSNHILQTSLGYRFIDIPYVFQKESAAAPDSTMTSSLFEKLARLWRSTFPRCGTYQKTLPFFLGSKFHTPRHCLPDIPYYYVRYTSTTLYFCEGFIQAPNKFL